MPPHKPTIWIHTSSASPYRRHLFEKISETFPNTRIFFYMNMQHEWYRYRVWRDDSEVWKVKCNKFRLRIPLPSPYSFVTIGLIWRLLRQPRNTVHIVGCVHENWILIMLSCALFRGKYVVWNDAGFPDSHQGIKGSRWYRHCRKHVAAAFTPGRLGRAFSSCLGISDNRIYNAYFSHDMDDYVLFYREKAQDGRKRIRAELGIRSGQPVILCVSRLLDLKRLVDLVEALTLLEQNYPVLAQELCFVLIGDGEDTSHKEALINLELIRVHHEKKVPYDEIKAWYCAADIFVLPSEGDIWGLVVNEALSLGLPVICTDVIGSAELVKDGWNGYLVKPRSPEMLMDRLVKLICNAELLESMKENAIKIHNSWNSDLAVSKLKRLIADITIDSTAD